MKVIFMVYFSTLLIPVAERSKASVCSRLLAGIAGLNPAGGHGCQSVVSVVCDVRYRSLRRADPSSRGVLPTVLCHCV